MLSNIRRLIGQARPYRRAMLTAIAAAVGVSAATAAQPMVVRAIIDRGLLGRNMSVVWQLVVVLVAVGLADAVLFSTRRRLVARYAYSTEADLRRRFFGHAQSLDHAFHEHISAGQLMSRGSADLQMAGEFLTSIPWSFTLTLQIVFALGAIFLLDAQLAVVAVALLPFLLVAGSRFATRYDPIVWRMQQKLADFAAAVEQTVTGIRVVKAFGREDHQSRRARREADAVHDASIEGVRLTAKFVPVFYLVPQIAVVVLIWLGGRRVLSGDISLGTLVAFNAYVAFLVFPLQEVGGLFAMAQRASTAAGRVFEVLDTPPAIVDAPDARQIDAAGHVRLDGVVLTYGGSRRILDGLDLDVPAGTSLALVGPTGCGKSTVIRLIARFADPDEGTVALDGHDVRSLSLQSLRSQLGTVFEDTFLFSDSIAANIAYGRPDASRSDVVAAARVAQAHDFIEEFADGYDSRVGEHGYTLSGGQRQRVALARAVLVSPAVLLLDDATSSVDAQVEAAIRAGLAAAMRGRTTILVARRPSSAALADRVALMQDGRVVAVGTHAELWDARPEYRRVLSADEDGGRGAGAMVPAAAAASDEPVATSLWGPPPVEVAADDEIAATPRHFGFRELRVLWPVLRPQAGRAALAAVLLVASQLAALASPFLLRHAIDNGIARGERGPIDQAALAMLVAALSLFVLMRASMVLAGRAGQGALRSLRRRLFDHLAGLDLAFFERERTGSIVSRLTADVQVIENLVTQGLLYAGALSVYLAGSLVVLFVLDVKLAAAALAVIGPPLVVGTVWFRARSEVIYTRVRETMAGVLSRLQETIRGVHVVQAFARERRNSEDFSERNDEWRDASIASFRLAAIYFPGVGLVRLLSTVVALGYGSWRVLQGDLTVGVLAAFLLYLSNTTEPIQALSQLYDQFQAAMAGLSRIAWLLDECATVTDRPGARPAGDVVGEQALESVTFSYAPNLPVALDGVDVLAAPGRVIALVGQTGAGKSTVAKLLLRFYDPTTGRVRLDDADLRDLSIGSLRQHTALVPQEGFLFSGTVLENIRFGRLDATDEEIFDLCRAIGAHELIERLPHAYDTEVGEHAAALSGGERQLIALARALLADPRILILDEATSALDPGTEARVQQALQHAFRDRTTILIAHRLSTVMRADTIVVVDHGRIAEVGSHDELVAREGGLYASLFQHWLVSA